jgi:SAM-dependent methyltransferase
MNCVVCGSKTKIIGQFPFADFDLSILNFTGTLFECGACGFVRVQSQLSDVAFAEHYATDCLYSEMSGVGVGGDTPEDLHRYKYYLDLIRHHRLSTYALVDVGCSQGGFLKFLRSQDEGAHAIGVEIDQKSAMKLRETGIAIRLGDALNLPFENNSRDILCYFHVLEHIYDFDAVLAEASRTLKPAIGVAIIEVPDAARYMDARVGTGFWLGMKEHVNHFTSMALQIACKRHGLEVVAFHRTLMPMKGNTNYPSLVAILYKTPIARVSDEDSVDPFAVGQYLRREIEFTNHLVNNIRRFSAEYDNIVFWGISLEFFNIYANGGVDMSKPVTLVDSNMGKQGKKVSGIEVIAPDCVRPSGGLVCCSYLSRESIMSAAEKLGWNKADIFAIS